MNSLNQLFQEILHSEKTFNDRLNYLKELNVQIESAQRDLLRAREVTSSLEGQRIIKTQSLVDSQLRYQLIQVKGKALDEKKKELESKVKDLENELDELTLNIEKEKQEFLTKLSEFNDNYDLKGSGIKYQEHQAQKQVKILQEETRLLEEKSVQIELKEEELRKIEKKLLEEEKPLQTLIQTMTKLKNEFDGLMSQKTSLEREKHLLTERLDEDPDLKKHIQELEACHNSSSERVYHQLQEELESLQHECYTRQMKYGQLQKEKVPPVSVKPSQSHVIPVTHPPKSHMTLTSMSHGSIIDLTVRDEEEEEEEERGNENDWESLDETELASIDAMEALYMEEEGEGEENLLNQFEDNFVQNLQPLGQRSNYQTPSSSSSSSIRSNAFTYRSTTSSQLLDSKEGETLLESKAKRVKFHY